MEEPARQKETIHYSFLKKKKKNLKYKILQWGKIPKALKLASVCSDGPVLWKMQP